MIALSNEKWAALTGTAFAGIATGGLAFVSAVDARSFIAHVDQERADVLQTHFQVWWPHGRDLMLPTLICGVLGNSAAWWMTSDSKFAWAAGLVGSVGVYTGVILGEDIQELRKSNPTQVYETARRFCNLHHVRLVLAGSAFALSLVGLAEL